MAKNSCMIKLKTVVAGLPANSEQGTPHHDTLMVHTQPAGKGIEMAMRSFLGSYLGRSPTAHKQLSSQVSCNHNGI